MKLEKNVYTVVENSLPPEALPVYPGFSRKIAKGGEPTVVLTPPSKHNPVDIEIQEAEPGEMIRNIDMMYLSDFSENLKFRIKRKTLCDADPAMRELEMKYCASSILYFVNTYCWTYDPRQEEGRKEVPFITFPFQDDWLTWRLWCMKYHNDCVTEKSRDQGISWLVQVLHVWVCLFVKGTRTYQLSMAEDDVDNRTTESLLGKARFLLNMLPPWMRQGWVERNTLTDQKMILRFPGTKSVIKGELTNTAGRGGRSTIADFDEFAFVDNSYAIMEACSSLAGSIGYNSTVCGMGNAFAKMAHSKGVNKKRLHWTLNPLKSKEWEIKEKAKPKYADESVWAQEQDINYNKSTTGRVYDMFKSHDKFGEGWSHAQTLDYYSYDPSWPVFLGLDLGINDPTSLVIFQQRVSHPDYRKFTEDTWVCIGEKEDSSWGVDEWSDYINELSNNKGYRIEEVVIDPRSGYAKDAKLKTWADYFREKGVAITDNRYKRTSEADTLTNMKQILRTPGKFCLYAPEAPFLVEAFENWSFPVDKNTGLVPSNAKPLHNEYSHSMKAVIYLMDYCVNRKRGTVGNQYGRKTKEKSWKFRA